jgi:hypothetical protein
MLCALSPQNPVLSREETWAHATAVPEVGGLLLATPDAPKLVGEAYWQVVIFLMRHDEQGSLGIILNRPTGLNMGRGRRGLPMRIQVGRHACMRRWRQGGGGLGQAEDSIDALGCDMPHPAGGHCCAKGWRQEGSGMARLASTHTLLCPSPSCHETTAKQLTETPPT